MSAEVVEYLVVYVIGTCTLQLTATTIRGTLAGSIFAFVLCCAAAYSLGCALELALLLVFVTASIEPLLMITWVGTGITGFLIARTTQPSGWMAMIPCCVVGVLMVMQGPLTGDPFSGLRFGQYAQLVSNLSIAAGMTMFLLSIFLGFMVGINHDAPRGTGTSTAAGIAS
jgi:hypothetical protein